jgi:hypothetical protein
MSVFIAEGTTVHREGKYLTPKIDELRYDGGVNHLGKGNYLKKIRKIFRGRLSWRIQPHSSKGKRWKNAGRC